MNSDPFVHMIAGRRHFILGPLVLAIVVMVMTPSIAYAFGGVFSPRDPPPDALRPSVARERVLLIYDAARATEHVVVDVRFRNALEPFGFVVPAPTRPRGPDSVHSPFGMLRAQLPFDPVHMAEDADVYVESVSLRSTSVRDASIAGLLRDWGSDEFVGEPGIDDWLGRYAAMRFLYMVSRYASLNADLAGSAPEFLDLGTELTSFTTSLPYFPYSEPGPRAVRGGAPCLLELWYVDTEPRVPIALHEHGDDRRWVRPLQEREVFLNARSKLEATLPPELQALLPAGELVVQTFQDQKSSRAGFGDILFAYRDRHDLDAEARSEIVRLLGLLDPVLMPEAE